MRAEEFVSHGVPESVAKAAAALFPDADLRRVIAAISAAQGAEADATIVTERLNILRRALDRADGGPIAEEFVWSAFPEILRIVAQHGDFDLEWVPESTREITRYDTEAYWSTPDSASYSAPASAFAYTESVTEAAHLVVRPGRPSAP